ncbi:MAG: bifunctional phosphoserine phosphatase/homoserine phosphotransferase ThrH [Promethearchaeota archaeon]|jgi:phosphoserine/homoserine phosphotransferase
MDIVCLDLEGVFTPEIWEVVAVTTGIDELKLTTRDIPDYDVLMKKRLKILEDNNISLKDIQEIITGIELLPGAFEFSNWLRSNAQVIIVTDSFIEFIQPFAKKLNYPLIFCHNLELNNKGMIINYNLRLKEMKKRTVTAFKSMNYTIIAIGDSYNDIGMLETADYGILFKPPENVEREYPQFPVITEYSKLKALISNHLGIK